MRLIDKDQLLRDLNTGMNIVEMMQKVMDAKEVKPKTGRWLRKLSQTPWPICSECGIYGANESNYCPNCGARMEAKHE